MSTINNALSELAKKQSTTTIEAAVVPKVKRRAPWIWVAAGFSVSLAMGGWAVSQAPQFGVSNDQSAALQTSGVASMEVQTTNEALVTDGSLITDEALKADKALTTDEALKIDKTLITDKAQGADVQVPPSPTQKVIHSEPIKKTPEPILVAQTATSQPSLSQAALPQTSIAKTEVQQVEKQSIAETTPAEKTIAENTVTKKTAVEKTPVKKVAKPSAVEQVAANPTSGIVVEQIELTPQQLAQNAVGRAKKALDSNDLDGALSGYTEALRYDSRDEDVRQRLAILYFGKGNTRKAYELFQSGIQLNKDSEKLRLGLSKLLIKANQSEAALSPLLHLPSNASKDYLAMRAALSQKSQHEEIALESYQRLVEVDADNARWWLGLAIQQERQLDFSAAKQSYQNALVRVGISSPSQNFVRDRLKILEELKDAADAN